MSKERFVSFPWADGYEVIYINPAHIVDIKADMGGLDITLINGVTRRIDVRDWGGVNKEIDYLAEGKQYWKPKPVSEESDGQMYEGDIDELASRVSALENGMGNIVNGRASVIKTLLNKIVYLEERIQVLQGRVEVMNNKEGSE